MPKDLWGSVLLFQVWAFRQLMKEAFSVWDSKYLTGKFRKIHASEFSRPSQRKRLSCSHKTKSTERRTEARKHREIRKAVSLCSAL